MVDEKKKRTQDIDWRYILQTGGLSGLILLFLGLVGMVADFNQREVVRDGFKLGQLLMVVIPFMMSYQATKRLEKEGTPPAMLLVAGLLIGVMTAIPSLLMLFFNAQVEGVADILVHVNRDWIETITFDNAKDLLLGSMVFMGFLTSSGALGSIFGYSGNPIIAKVARAILFGTSFTLLILMFGETTRLIAQEILPDSMVDFIFRRGTIKNDAAIILLIASNIISFIGVYAGKTISQNYDGLPNQQKKTSRIVAWVIFGAFLLMLPSLIGRTLSDVAVQVGLFILMGFGLNIAIGLAGLLDLGYVTNYAVGAYVMAVLTTTGPLGQGSGLNFWIVIPISLLAAMFAGFFFAMPVLKMRGDYLAIATLGFGEIIGKLAISDWLKPVIGGAQGVLQVPKPVFFGLTLKDPEQLYYIVLAACVITLFVSIRINNSRTGRQWMAIREDEDVAAAMGINVPRAKLLAFTISAATGGVAGAIFAAKVGTVFPTSFTVFVSINVLSLIIVGGMGSNPGIVLGAIALIGMPELLREFSEYRFLIYGALLVFMMVNRPEGLWPSQVRQREIHAVDENPQPRAIAAGD
jgi:branched-chain amino acid transport system permease protein